MSTKSLTRTETHVPHKKRKSSVYFLHMAPMSPSYDSSVGDDCFYFRGCPAAMAITDTLAGVLDCKENSWVLSCASVPPFTLLTRQDAAFYFRVTSPEGGSEPFHVEQSTAMRPYPYDNKTPGVQSKPIKRQRPVCIGKGAYNVSLKPQIQSRSTKRIKQRDSRDVSSGPEPDSSPTRKPCSTLRKQIS